MQTDNAMAIEAKNISFAYEQHEPCEAMDSMALRNISVAVPKGQFIMIMGASGAGKSTFANALNGLVPHFIGGRWLGKLYVDGVNTTDADINELVDKVGLVFQDFEAQLFSTTVEMEVAFGMENRGYNRDEMHKRIKNIIMEMGLAGLESRAPSSLSGGQKQRLAIAAIVATEPVILCLDEPTTDLDPIGKQGIFELLVQLRDQKETVVVIEHETEEAVYADRLLVLDRGRVVADGNPAKILADIPLFNKMGLMPFPLLDYFRRLGVWRGCDSLPCTVEDAKTMFIEKGLSISAEKYAALVKDDNRKMQEYGKLIVEVRDLSYDIAGKSILHNINLLVGEKEFVAVLGANGSGKTTLAKHLNGLLRVQSGKGMVYIGGNDNAKASLFDIGHIVGYVFQNPDQQIFSNTVFEEVSYGVKLRGLTDAEADVRVKEALKAVGLSGYEEKDPFSLAKGERQRVAVASVLAMKPKIIVLDEPTTGLDYKDQKQMMELIKKLNEEGHTIIIITHTMWVVAEYAHRVILLNSGRVVADGKVRDVFADSDEVQQALRESCIKIPQITALANSLGYTALSVEELVGITEVTP